MGRLYGSLAVLGLLFAAAMATLTAGIFLLDWVWAGIGMAASVLFVALGGVLVPPARKALPASWDKVATALLQFFGAYCALLATIMATIGWIAGNRIYYASVGYQVLGIFVFLALVGVGIPGSLGALVRFFYVHHRLVSEQRVLHDDGGHVAPDVAVGHA